jgi:hypothetical protein
LERLFGSLSESNGSVNGYEIAYYYPAIEPLFALCFALGGLI